MAYDKSIPFSFSKNGIFYFERRVPRDLRNHYSTSKIAYSLRTRSASVSDGSTRDVQDYLSLALVGAPGVIFVGALQTNGYDFETATEKYTTDPALMASYSTIAGSLGYGNSKFSDQYLVVGVDAGRTFDPNRLDGGEFVNYGSACGTVDGTCLYGTSFAAPIVAGYAAIVAQKFPQPSGQIAKPSDVATRLLETARKDTVVGYHVNIHGQGEACLSCALGAAWVK